MPDDALQSVLRLVAEGRLTAEEAGPILDALDGRSDRAADAATTDDPIPAAGSATSPGGGPARAIRIEVVEHDRQVVNLRVPLALGRAALHRIPGLSEAITERVREALEAGVRGPIVSVDDGDKGSVRIVVE